MSRLDKLYDMTVNLKAVLDQDITPENRDEIIIKVHELLDQRASEIRKRITPYTKEEKQLGHKIVLLNDVIETQMDKHFEDLRQEMKQTKKQKKLNRSYINPYGKITSTDGMYVDSKQ